MKRADNAQALDDVISFCSALDAFTAPRQSRIVKAHPDMTAEPTSYLAGVEQAGRFF